jgi:hypothetical protein
MRLGVEKDTSLGLLWEQPFLRPDEILSPLVVCLGHRIGRPANDPSGQDAAERCQRHSLMVETPINNGRMEGINNK